MRRPNAERAGRTLRVRLADDSGISMTLVAIALTTMMGMSALVIDLGNGWRTRRAIIPATDAAALAAAQDYVNGNDGCAAIAGSYLSNNETAATLDSCTPHSYSSDRGRVTVAASHNVQTWFAPVLGLGDYTVTSTSTATWGPPVAATGLRPIGLCLNGSAVLQDAIASATASTITISYSKDQPDACGGANIPGNWGTVDFDGGANSNSDTKDWVTNGYPNPVNFDNHTVTTCVGDPHCYEGDTGAIAGINAELNALKNSGAFFTLPVFNFAENPGGNAMFHLAGVVRVQLIDFKVNGAEANRFFTFYIEPGLTTGVCCGGGGGAGGVKVIALCGVDPNQFAACDP